MSNNVKIREIECKSAIGKCGFPGGGWAVNPYTGCGHNCRYCYARFIKRFTGHNEEWGSFVDVRVNVVEMLEKQMRSPKYKNGQIHIGTVTDPYQPIEEKYKLMPRILEVLAKHNNPVAILTKSDLVLRDIDLLKKIKDLDVNFTINTLDDKWKSRIEPCSPSIKGRLIAAKKLTDNGIRVYAMMGPYWPVFTEPDALFEKFKEAGISHVFTESFNTTGGNFTGVDEILRKHYPGLLSQIRETLFDKDKFNSFYKEAEKKVRGASRKYKIPVTIFFGLGHAAKFD